MANEFIIKNGFHSKGDSQVTGSLILSQSYTAGDTDSTALRLLGSGSVSQSGIFEVEGSAGPLFSVADGLDGVLMEVNNISGLPLFQVSSSNEVFINRGNLTIADDLTVGDNIIMSDGGKIVDAAGNNDEIIFDQTNRNIHFLIDNNQTLVVGNERVGIGTSTPGEELEVVGDISASGNITGNSFVKGGGTSAQFLKADGSVDSSTYLTSVGTINLTSGVTGILPVTNGGTGVNTVTAGRILIGNGTSALATDSGFTYNTSNKLLSAPTASFAHLIVSQVISSSVINTSGSNIFGDEATDTQTLNGSVILNNISTDNSQTTALFIDTSPGGGSNTIKKRTLQANAFTSTTIGTTTNALTVSTGLNLNSGTTFNGSAAKTISVDVSDFMTNGSNNRIVTATGTDAMNAEANLTFDGSTLALTGDFNVGSGDLFVDDSTGRVGIGTTNPLSRLSVDGTFLVFDSSEGNDGLKVDASLGTFEIGDLEEIWGGAKIEGNGTNITIKGNITASSNISASGNITGNSFVKGGGTSAQFLKADGSVDSSTYLTSVGTINLASGVTGTLPVANGGTGASVASTARANLGAAASGANTDITSIINDTLTTIGSSAEETTENYINFAAGKIALVQGLNLVVHAGAEFRPGTTNSITLGTSDYMWADAYSRQFISDGSTTTNPAFVVDKDETNTGFYYKAARELGISVNGGEIGYFNGDGLQVTVSGATSQFTGHLQAHCLGIGTTPSTVSGEIRAAGDIIANYSSDKRLKTNIKPISSALDKLLQISGVTFDWIKKEEIHSHKGHDVGVIAQEVEAVLPEVVVTRDNGYKAVNYEKIVPLLIESIKELKAEIDELKKSK